MRLSIVVPVLDDARHLSTLLAALARQAPGLEVIVADGGSRDGSLAVAAAAPGVRLVSSARGRARQMNAGAARATGDVLLFLHADTHLPPAAVPAVDRALADPGVVYGRFDVRFDNPGTAFRMIAWLMNQRSRLTGICTGDQAIFVRRATLARLGGYPEIALMEDIALTHQLKRLGRWASIRLPVTTSARRWERDGVARTIVVMWILRFLYFCGVHPTRLHRWYYGEAADAPSDLGVGAAPPSAAMVPHGASPRVAPPSPPAHALDAAPQEQGRHRE